MSASRSGCRRYEWETVVALVDVIMSRATEPSLPTRDARGQHHHDVGTTDATLPPVEPAGRSLRQVVQPPRGGPAFGTGGPTRLDRPNYFNNQVF
jgi:hypothetical protein